MRSASGIKHVFRQVLTALGAVLAVVALLVILAREVREYPFSTNWPVTSGEVTVSRIVGNSDSTNIDFEYEYRVGSTTYTGDRITFFEYVIQPDLEQQHQFISDHPIGSQVSVHYNPANPARSVIMRTIPLSRVWSSALITLCLAGVLAASLAGLILRRLWHGTPRCAEDLPAQA